MRAPKASTVLIVLLAAAPAVTAYLWATPEAPKPSPILYAPLWSPAELNREQNDAAATSRLWSVSLLPDGSAAAAGPGTALWRSGDAGRSWTAVVTDSSTRSRLAVALGPDGVMLAIGSSGATIDRSEDGGVSWRTVHSRTPGPLARIRFVGEARAVSVGARTVLTSVDGGTHWSAAPVPSASYHDVDFHDNIGIVVGSGGGILRSIDGGASWRTVRSPSNATLHGVAFAGGLSAVAVGAGGLILRSEDAGLTWNRTESTNPMPLRAIEFVNERDGFAVGFFGTVLRTRDGGLSWHPEESGTRAHLFDVASSGNRVIATGWFDTIVLRDLQP